MEPVRFRESQRKIIEEYQGGLMGIAAVPGSGKTFTLSHLAARLVEKIQSTGRDDQEVLVVTFSNSAVNSFKKRIADILRYERQLLPYVGYRVRTLHGLAHDIVRERPALVGLAEDFQIVDERVSSAILQDVIYAHLPMWQGLFDNYIDPDLTERQQQRVRTHDFPSLLGSCAERFIKHAKDQEISPKDVQHKLADDKRSDVDLLRFVAEVYVDYQRNLAFRGAVDFDDLVVLALRALRSDEQYLERLHGRWLYVLEDEAQDSSEIQEKMLKLLTHEENWVRVGDPNQAINTTFTTADPKYLREFLDRRDVVKRDLPTSGRSGQPIIDMANELVRWACQEHPALPLRDAFYYQEILPTESGDPQPNPLAENTRIHIHYEPGVNISPEQEIEIVVRSLKKWLAENQNKTVACLVPENSRGFKLVEALRAAGIPYEELLRSTTGARLAASYLSAILLYLSAPQDSGSLARFYRDVWWHLTMLQYDEYDVDLVYQLIHRVRQVEDLVWSGGDDLRGFEGLDVVLFDNLQAFLAFVRFCLAAMSLPVDQLVLTVSQRVFRDPIDVALSYKVASFLRGLAEENLGWSLVDFAAELRSIVENQRRFIGFDDASEGFSPTAGVVTVSTMHAAKGLEWDRVYLLAVNNYGFPSLQAVDAYVSERWFVRDDLNLEEEVLEQLRSVDGRAGYVESHASLLGREGYGSERLRLLYVALTRARSEVVVTWNLGRYFDKGIKNSLAVPLLYLVGFSGG